MHKFLLSAGLAVAMVSLQAQTTPANSNNTRATNQQGSTYNNQSSQAGANQNGMQNSKANLSSDINGMLRDTHAARQAISKQDKQMALKDVNEALRASHRLNQASGNNQLVPLYTEVSEYSVLAPVKAAKANTSANQVGNQTNNQTSNLNQKASSRPEDAFSQAAGEYTTVALNAQEARMHLQAAKQALGNGNMKAADNALAAVQDGIIVETVEADLPLMRARENLRLARMAAKEDHYGEARAALHAASRSLGQYEQEGGQHVNDAKQLQAQIDSYDQNISQNHSGAASKIESWWKDTTNWNMPANATTAQSQNGSNNAVTAHNNSTSNHNPSGNYNSAANNNSAAGTNSTTTNR